MSRILVTDDSQVIRDLLGEFFAGHGYDVALACDAESARRSLRERRPQLILLDVRLPDVDGREFCRMLRSRPETRSIPVVLITGSEQDKVSGFQAGADDYVMKPLDLPELLERVRAVLRRAAAAPRTPAASAAPEPEAPRFLVGGEAPELGSTLAMLLLSPAELPTLTEVPGSPAAFLGVLAALLLSGAALCPVPALTPLTALLLGLGGWAFLCAALAVGCSLAGLALSWGRCARLLCLAGAPILLKLAGGLALTWQTTLSPHLFGLSPALFWPQAPAFLGRLDAFELWATFLLWVLLRRQPGGGALPAATGTLGVWLSGNLLALCLTLWGGVR